MDRVRPARVADLEALLHLATLTGFGLTTLPRDPEFLRKRLVDSERSFAHDADEPRGEPYLFVLESGADGAVIGTSAIWSKVGGFEPFYAYRLETALHESKMLGVRKEVPVLHLDREHSGPCDVGGLFLAPEARAGGRGRLLSLARFLFMAEHPRPFDPEVISEIRGVSDSNGESPFWEGLGRHFFDIDFPKADYLSLLNKRFIADLMPVHPIYIPLLPAAAQAVIGEAHPMSRGALKMLEAEGFRRSGMVDVFDAGPVIHARLEDVRTVRESVRAEVEGLLEAAPGGEEQLVCRAASKGGFRAVATTVQLTRDAGVRLSRTAAERLEVAAGDHVRFAPSRATAGGESGS